MGRLPSVGVLLLARGCEEKRATPTAGRSESVIGSAIASASAPAASSAPVVAPPRKLCTDQAGRSFPKQPTVKVIDSAGAITTAQIDMRGNFTWVNFWAAWCGPCKEEIPRLRSWKTKLSTQGVKFELALVSLDDDERQLSGELATQTDPNAKKSLWLPDGPLRAAVLGPLKMKSAAALPMHVLIDPEGKIRCFVDGAVEDRDFDEVARLVK
jgi:thiol-disulfide isomerase/thioredoxin